MMFVRLSSYVVVMHIKEEVLKWYPMLSFSSHLRRNYRKIINRCGMKVSPCIVPRLISIRSVVPK